MEATQNASAALPEVVLTRVFNAPRELVFKAWTEPERLAQWWGPHGFTNPVCQVDVRPGGAILIHMQWPGGSQVSPMKGTFREIQAPERLVFSATAHADENAAPMLETLNTITFIELAGGKTELTVRAKVVMATPEATQALAGMNEGWKQSLEKLTAYLAKG